MKDKQLTAQEKATLVASVDQSISDSVKSIRKKMIQEGYLTSFTQVQVLDKLLWGVKEAENANINPHLMANLVMTKQIALIQNIAVLFKEGWMLSRAFKFYVGNTPIKEVNGWKLRRILEVIEKKDRSDFSKFEVDTKTVVKKPITKAKSNQKKPSAPKPQVAGKDVIIIKK